MLNKFCSRTIALIVTGLVSLHANAGPGAHGPDGEHLDMPAHSGTNGLVRLPDGSVSVPKAGQRRMAIRTLMAQQEEHALTVELNGSVGIDPNSGGRVQAPFAGRIEPGPQGFPVAGQRVRKGEVLARISPVAGAIEQGNQQAQLIEIRSSRQLAEQRVKRLEALEGTVPRKDIEAARAELASLEGRERAISASVASHQSVVAAASGLIASANVLSGQIVDARDVLFEIVDPNRMVVEAITTDITLAEQIGSASLRGYPGVKLTLLGRGRSLRDGALPISFRASATNIPLAVGQPVTVIARLNRKTPGIALPAEAVVRNQNNEPVVWIKSGAERFIPQPVQFKPLDATNIVITKGLAPDNRVVVSGASLINQIR